VGGKTSSSSTTAPAPTAPSRPTSHTLLSRAWSAAEPFFQTRHQPAAHPAPAREINSINRLPSSFSLPSLPTQVKWVVAPEGRDEEQIEFSWAGETVRHVGTVVHRWLQRIAEDELRGWDANRIDSIAFHRELQRRGVRAEDTRAAGDLVKSALKNTLLDERGRWAVGPHPEARSEYRVRENLARGTPTFDLDHLFRDRDGVPWVVDFKTSRHEGTNVDAFLDRERKRYAQQMHAYVSTISGVCAALYFPLLRGWRSW
jgi:ATP-dependent helicase/nuclease subunit A